MQLSNPLPGCDANSLRAKTKVKAVCTCISSCWNMCTAVSTCDASMQASTIACYSTACYQHYSYYRVLYRVSITLHCTCIQHPCHRDMKQQGCVPTSDGYTFHPHIIIVYYHAVIECIEYHTHLHVIETWSSRAIYLPVTASKDSPVATFPQLPAP